MLSFLKLRWRAVLAIVLPLTLVGGIGAAVYFYGDTMLELGASQIQRQWLQELQNQSQDNRERERAFYERVQDANVERTETLRCLERRRAAILAGGDDDDGVPDDPAGDCGEDGDGAPGPS